VDRVAVDRSQAQPAVPLSRDRGLRAAVAVADARGIEALTMRNLADALGVEAMSLYHHVANKEDVLDGVVDLVMEEVEASVNSAGGPAPRADWRAALRTRALAARRVLLRHPWAPRLIGSRPAASLGIMRYFDGVVELLISGGFSYDLAHHALHALDSRALGFTQELFDPNGSEMPDEAMMEQLATQMPNLSTMLANVMHDEGSTLGFCDDQEEFEFSLNVLLDGLEHRRKTQ
jgi:AcrR family transcriptional regulator